MADDLAFGGWGFSPKHLQELSISELLYWHDRAGKWAKRPKPRG